MIHVTWPMGCYGSYVMQSIYAYSNLGNASHLDIHHNGSSHNFRSSVEQKKYFIYSHDSSINADICIQSLDDHKLDYMNNQLVKQDHSNIYLSIQQSFPGEWNSKFTNWPVNARWALREWISFWIMDNMQSAYQYKAHAHITTGDLFNTDINVFPKLISRLGLTVTASDAIMKYNQQQWIAKQRYHNSQNKCNAWIHDILHFVDTPTPCNTILDEAYVQYCLRDCGYEIRCDGLNIFPATSNELRELIYENSDTDN